MRILITLLRLVSYLGLVLMSTAGSLRNHHHPSAFSPDSRHSREGAHVSFGRRILNEVWSILKHKYPRLLLLGVPISRWRKVGCKNPNAFSHVRTLFCLCANPYHSRGPARQACDKPIRYRPTPGMSTRKYLSQDGEREGPMPQTRLVIKMMIDRNFYYIFPQT